MIHLDTAFLVDLLRERRRGRAGPATALALQLENKPLGYSPPVACELFAGAENADSPEEERQRVEEILAALEPVTPGLGMARAYGRVLIELRRAGAVISTMDLLIGCAAVAEGVPLVTRNTRHFSRIRGLELLTY